MHNKIHSKTFKDLTGLKFGCLKVLRYSHTDSLRCSYYVCKCDCGREVIKSRGKITRSPKRCSLSPKDCNNYYNEFKCIVCGNIKKNHKSHFKVKEESKYMCHDCKLKSFVGKNSSRYKHGNYTKTTEIGRSKILETRKFPEYKAWRKEVLAKDKYICQICFSNGHGLEGKLEAHHLIPWADIMLKNNIDSLESMKNCKELWDVNNGVTFCKSCHKDVHFIAKEYGVK